MKILPFLLLTLVFFSCKNEEAVYPFDQSPYVKFEDLKFYDGEFVDTLALSFIVWDIEGDIGVNSDNYDYPLHQFNAVIDSNDELVKIDNEVTPPLYSIPMNQVYDWDNGVYQFISFPDYKTLVSNKDSRSDFNCDSYLIFEDYLGYDTIFGSQNRNRNSLQIEFLTEDREEFDFNEYFNTDQCGLGDFDARIPELDIINFGTFNGGVFQIRKRDKYSYNITYLITSVLLKLMFLDNKMEIKFQVLDRELNKSNFGSSGLVTLQEITN